MSHTDKQTHSLSHLHHTECIFDLQARPQPLLEEDHEDAAEAEEEEAGQAEAEDQGEDGEAEKGPQEKAGGEEAEGRTETGRIFGVDYDDTVQGSAERWSPGSVNAAGKATHKWTATAGTKFTKPGDRLLAELRAGCTDFIVSVHRD